MKERGEGRGLKYLQGDRAMQHPALDLGRRQIRCRLLGRRRA